MAVNASAFGASLRIIASVTFPQGFTVTKFSDESNPFETPSMQIADKAMGLNGDLVFWSKANTIPFNTSILPNTDDAQNLGILFEANRVAKGKKSANDVITIIATYPDGKIITYTNGLMTDGTPASNAASSGRLTSLSYSFAFENKTGF